MHPAEARPILRAELLSIGSELTVGETRDTNGGDLARGLTDIGVHVTRLSALPDELGVVRDAIATALERADLVVTTGGMGPTPDDLTREAIAAACGETPTVDPELERWLRELWSRRKMPFPEANLKQAWRIPSCIAIPNNNGTAPGWWVDRPDGRVIVALPGPPREMLPMWTGWVLARLHGRGLGEETAVRTLRLTGIGESQVAERLGETLLRAANPVVATYARRDAVDVRIAAVAEPAADGRPARSADQVAEATESIVTDLLDGHVWGRGEETWPEAIGAALGRLGWRMATVEIGTGAALASLFGSAGWLVRAESLAPDADQEAGGPDLASLAERARRAAGVELGLAIAVAPRGADTAVSLAIASPEGVHRERRLAFMRGDQGLGRAALAAAAVLLGRLRAEAATGAETLVAAPDAADDLALARMEVPR